MPVTIKLHTLIIYFIGALRRYQEVMHSTTATSILLVFIELSFLGYV